MKRKTSSILFWLPRILSITFILFLAVFSLDVFSGGVSVFNIIIGLLMHNIPSIVLTVMLIIAWKHELVGAVVFALVGILYVTLISINMFQYHFEWYMLSYSLIIAGPAFLMSGLFFLNWRNKSRTEWK